MRGVNNLMAAVPLELNKITVTDVVGASQCPDFKTIPAVQTWSLGPATHGREWEPFKIW